MEGIWFRTRLECSDTNKLRWQEIESQYIDRNGF